MPDRISSMRTVRLVLHVPQVNSPLAAWALHTVATRRGVPDLRVLQNGYVPLPSRLPTEAQIWEALQRVTDQYAVGR